MVTNLLKKKPVTKFKIESLGGKKLKLVKL